MSRRDVRGFRFTGTVAAALSVNVMLDLANLVEMGCFHVFAGSEAQHRGRHLTNQTDRGRSRAMNLRRRRVAFRKYLPDQQGRVGRFDNPFRYSFVSVVDLLLYHQARPAPGQHVSLQTNNRMHMEYGIRIVCYEWPTRVFEEGHHTTRVGRHNPPPVIASTPDAPETHPGGCFPP